MKRRKIKYNEGDNKIFDYYIITEKSEIVLAKDSLAYKIDLTSDKAYYFDLGSAQGNFDFLIAEHKKNGDFVRVILCDSSQISFCE